MDNLRAPRRDTPADSAPFLQYEHLSATSAQRGRNCQADGAGADDDRIEIKDLRHACSGVQDGCGHGAERYHRPLCRPTRPPHASTAERRTAREPLGVTLIIPRDPGGRRALFGADAAWSLKAAISRFCLLNRCSDYPLRSAETSAVRSWSGRHNVVLARQTGISDGPHRFQGGMARAVAFGSGRQGHRVFPGSAHRAQPLRNDWH